MAGRLRSALLEGTLPQRAMMAQPMGEAPRRTTCAVACRVERGMERIPEVGNRLGPELTGPVPGRVVQAVEVGRVPVLVHGVGSSVLRVT